MNASTDRPAAADRLTRLRARIDEHHLAARIDEPIDRALAAFTVTDSEPFSQEAFHRTLAAWVRCLADRGLLAIPGRGEGSRLAEGIDLIERLYRSDSGIGHQAAFVDAAEEINRVFDRLTEALKRRRRAEHLRAVFLVEYHGLPWPVRRQITAEVLEHLAPDLPPVLARCPIELLVDELPGLLAMEQDLQRLLERLVAGSAVV